MTRYGTDHPQLRVWQIRNPLHHLFTTQIILAPDDTGKHRKVINIQLGQDIHIMGLSEKQAAQPVAGSLHHDLTGTQLHELLLKFPSEHLIWVPDIHGKYQNTVNIHSAQHIYLTGRN